LTRAENSLFYVNLESTSLPNGVAFFVKSRLAVTWQHLFVTEENGVNKTLKIVGDIVWLVQNELCVQMRIISLNEDMDYALLEPVGDFTSIFMNVSRLRSEPQSDYYYVLHFIFGMYEQSNGKPMISFHDAIVSKISGHNLYCNAQNFFGDSCGGIILAETGNVVGMRLENINNSTGLDDLQSASYLNKSMANSWWGLILALVPGLLQE
jgi:hypothetical protein